jgi:hypothetical protein
VSELNGSSRYEEVNFYRKNACDSFTQECQSCGGKHSVNRCPAQHRYCNNCNEKGHYFRQCPKKKKSTDGAGGNQYRDQSRSHGRGGRINRSSMRGRSNQDVKQVQTGDEIDGLMYTFQDFRNENIPWKGKYFDYLTIDKFSMLGNFHVVVPSTSCVRYGY